MQPIGQDGHNVRQDLFLSSEDTCKATPSTRPRCRRRTRARSSTRGELESQVKEMYRQVAARGGAELHFEVGRTSALQLGYPAELLDAIPAEALASFAGVGYHLDLAALQPGRRACSTSAPARAPTSSAPRARSARRPRRRRRLHRRAARQGDARCATRRLRQVELRRGHASTSSRSTTRASTS